MDWLTRLKVALEAEAALERDELTRARALPWAEQVALGVAWPTVKVTDGEPAGRGASRWVVRPVSGALHDGIGPGEAVEVEGGGLRWRGRCEAAEPGWAELRVDAEEDPPAQVRVARRFDPSSWERYATALRRASSPSPLQQVLLGEARPTWSAEVPPLDPGLNDAQRAAAEHALAADQLAVLHGPPGTGKTRTLAAILAALVRAGERPWALADSNAAVDHLAVSAAAHGMQVVRVGPLARIGGPARPLTLDARMERHPVAPALAQLRKELSRLRTATGPDARRQRQALVAERERLRDQARREILEGADVIATTFGTLARMGDRLPPARTAVVDEATQAMEPATWVPVAWVQRLILAGDPHQLGPVTRDPRSPLADSLLQRLVAAGTPAPMLEVQHRMHADIQALVAGVYGPRYRPDPAVEGHHLPDWPVVRWLDTAGAGFDEARDPTTGSLYNAEEAERVGRAVAAWREAGLSPEQIGVITPYSAQVARLQADPRLAGVEVATVNAFQGREKEAICCSFVRSNPDGEVGFVADPRRLTVALTRARKAWLGIGDSATLSRIPRFAELFDRIAAMGALGSVWEE